MSAAGKPWTKDDAKRLQSLRRQIIAHDGHDGAFRQMAYEVEEKHRLASVRTITIQLGNTDNRLTQHEWAQFVAAADALIKELSEQVYFFGAPPSWEKWQNVAWVFAIAETAAMSLRFHLKKLREEFRQDSAAWTEGKTEFV